MTEKLILEKLDVMEKKVDKIETAVGLIAVQSERIDNLSKQINSLWIKYDDAFGQTGIISEIRSFQASCPRETIPINLKRQWAAIALLAGIVVGSFLKLIV